MRPAINAGLSVSRVGGSAQIKGMRKVSGTLRVELAQYRELANFAQFGSDLDKNSLDRLEQGRRIMEILKQPQYETLEVEKQIVLLYAVTHKFLMTIPVEEVKEYEHRFLRFMEEQHNEILESVKANKELLPEVEDVLVKALFEFRKQFDARNK